MYVITFHISPDQVRDPVGDVATFMEEYERSYGPNHPTFHRGSYAQVNMLVFLILLNAHFVSYQALEVAKRELRFLLVC